MVFDIRMISVTITTSFEKKLLKAPKNIQKLVARRLLTLKSDPYFGKPLSGKLKGSFSIRVWPYRILYQFNQKTKCVYVYKIQHRKDVYKN